MPFALPAFAARLCGAAALALGLSTAAADAAVIIDIWDDGSAIHAQGRGTLLLPSAADGYPALSGSFLYGNQPAIGVGVRTGGAAGTGWATGPQSHLFGNRGIGNATEAAGPVISLSPSSFTVDVAYSSGDPWTAWARWDGWTIDTGGLFRGVHVYSIGTDTITLAIGDAAIASLSEVPVPAAAPLLLGALGGLLALRRRARG